MKALSVDTLNFGTIYVCLNCLAEVGENANFCHDCGKDVEEADVLYGLEDIITELRRLKKI